MVTVSSTTGEQVLDDPLVGALETVEWLGGSGLEPETLIDTGTVEKMKKTKQKQTGTGGQWTSTNVGLAQARPNYQVS